MAFNLRKLLEEGVAQVNPFDGGKTAATVRRAAAPPPPAQTMRRPAPQNSITNNPLTRGFSRAYDQANIFDNGLSWQTRTPTQTQSVRSQAANIGKEVARPFVEPVNTARAGVGATYGLGKIAKASVFGSDQDYKRTVNDVYNTANRDLSRKGGLLGIGSAWDSVEQGANATPREIAGKSINYGTQIGTTVAPVVPIKGLGVVGSRLVNNAVQSGAGSVAGQYAANGRVNLGQVAKDTAVGTAAGEVLPAASAITRSGARAVKAAPNVARVANTKLVAPVAANEGGYIQLPNGRREIVTDVPSRFRGVAPAVEAGTLSNKVEIVPRGTIKRGADTYGDLDQARIRYYQDLIRRDQPVAPLILDKNGLLADGKHRLAAMSREGITDVPVVRQIPKQRELAGAAQQSWLSRATNMGEGGGMNAPRNKAEADAMFGENGRFSGEGVKPKDPYIQEYADSLRQMESGRTGGQMIADGQGGYKRITEHSPFYREHFKQTGRAPTREDYYAEAARQVESGKADKDFMDYYSEMVQKRGTAPDTAKVLDNTPPKRMNDAEWQSLQNQAMQEAPKSKAAVQTIAEPKRLEQKQAVLNGDLDEAARLRQEIGDLKDGTLRDAPDLNKAVQDDLGKIELKDIKGRPNKELKQKFMSRANEYLGSKKAAEYSSVDKARQFNESFGDLTDAQKLEVIKAADNPAYETKDLRVQQAVDALHREYDSAYRMFTQDKGINMGYQHSYYPRMYKHPDTGEALTSAEFDLLVRGSSRQKGRTADQISTDFLITKDPAEALTKYHKSLENAAAGKKFLNDLEQDGLVIRSSEPVRGMRPVVAEGMQEGGTIFYARPEVAKSLDRMFGTQEASGAFEKLVEKGQGINSFMQSVVLSGGIPNTPVNAFGFMQVMKSTMAGHPVQAGKAFFGSLSRKNTDNFFKQNSDILQLMSKNGLDTRIGYHPEYRSMFTNIKNAKGVTGTLGEAWDQVTNDATFQRFMPMLEVMHYKNVYNGLLKKGAAPEKAAQTAAKATSNFFGKTDMARQAVRSKTGQDFLGAVAFAPRFRESMVNFWGKNIQSLSPKNLGKKEFRDNQKFMASAAAVWAAMEGANYALNGNWMHDNPDGKKDKLLIPGSDATNGKYMGIPFLPSIATVPRNIASGAYNLATGNFKEAGKNAASFASMPLKTAGEVLTNENYFGQRIVDEDAGAAEKVGQMGAHIVKNNMQPWVREGVNIAGKNLPEGAKKVLGIKDKSGIETASNALEAPLRFYDPNYFRGDEKFGSGRSGTVGASPIKSIKDMEARQKDQSRQLKRSLSDEDYALSKLSKSERQELVDAGVVSQDKLDGLDNYIKGKKKELGMEVAEKATTPRQKYESTLKEFEKKKDKYTPVERTKAQKDLRKLKVAADYDNDTLALHGMSKEDIYSLVSTDPNGKAYVEKLLAYDDALTKAGLQDKNKFRDKNGNPRIKPTDRTASGGGRKKTSYSLYEFANPLDNDRKLRQLLKKATASLR